MDTTTVAPASESTSADHPYSLPLELTVTDPEMIGELCQRREGRDRDEYALSALRLGLLALRQARGQVDAQAIQQAGDKMLLNLRSAIDEHRKDLNRDLGSTLKQYFDPDSGHFHERVNRLLKKDGELETLISRTMTAEDSDLSRALESHMGEDSPLFQLLEPGESNGLLKALNEVVSKELVTQRERVLGEFSLDNKQSALSRLVGELSDHNGKLRDDLKLKIDEVVKEFSLHEEDSALSRLVRQVDQAQKKISAEFSLDTEHSALSRLRQELLGVLGKHEDRAVKFQEEVHVTLGKMQARKTEAQRSTQHGNEFEAAVVEFLHHEAQRAGDIATATGNVVGLISNCKIGDIEYELSADSATPGAKIVIEAKEKAGYSLRDALDESQKARENRAAQVGLFVFSAKTAPAGLDLLKRYGDDVVVVWDADDAQSDLRLTLALSVARALCTRAVLASERQTVDFLPIEKAIQEILKQVEALDEINKSADTILKGGNKILDRVRITREKLSKQADILREQMDNLKEELATE